MRPVGLSMKLIFKRHVIRNDVEPVALEVATQLPYSPYDSKTLLLCRRVVLFG